MKSVVITGASSGIGEAIATTMATAGWQVFAGVRDDADANRLASLHGYIVPVMLDVTASESLSTVEKTVSKALYGKKLAGLVNNAGVAKPAPLSLQPAEDVRAHFDVNVLGAISMIRTFAPLLGQNEALSGRPGRIINITSLGGQIPSPFLGAYTATKHAMESVTDTVRMELRLFGIDAISIGPGATKTPIWKKAMEEDLSAYKQTPFGKPMEKFLKTMVDAGESGLEPDSIGELVKQALTVASPKPRYNPAPNKLTNYYLLKALPFRLKDSLFASKFGLDRNR